MNGTNGLIRRIAGWVWLGASLVQLVVWVLVCVLGHRLVAPWWLWTVAVGGAAVAIVWHVTAPERARVHEPNTETSAS